MQKVKNAIKGAVHRRDKDDNMTGGTTYEGGSTTYESTGSAGMMGTAGHHHHSHVTDEVVGERAVAYGIAEVPVVITEQERISTGGTDYASEQHLSRSSEHVSRSEVYEQERVSTGVSGLQTVSVSSGSSGSSGMTGTTGMTTGIDTGMSGMATGVTAVTSAEARGEVICGQKTFTEIEDRPVIRERVERIIEHRPVEKQYVVETRFVGEVEKGIAGAEIVGVKERVVDVAEPGPACPANAGQVMNAVVDSMNNTRL